jgi:predicted permease
MLKGLVAPLSMVVIGLRLADMKFDGMLKDKYMYLFLALRHVILPLAVVGVVKLAGLFITIDPVVGMVCVILAAAPAATSATMFAEMYDCDANYVSRLVTVSTLLSILTMPVILLLM